MTRENLLEKVIKKIEEIEPDKWLRSCDNLLTTYSTNLKGFSIMLYKDIDYESSIPTYQLRIFDNTKEVSEISLVLYLDGANNFYKNPAEEQELIENLFYRIESDFKDSKKTKTKTKTDLLLEALLGKLGGK